MNIETEYDEVYGKTFSRYSPDQLAEFTNFFKLRFSSNNLDPKIFFGGKSVLDCGCGNGRGSIFAASNDALEISCIDLSSTNIQSTSMNLKKVGAKIKYLHHGALESMPFNNDEFDVIWCNGVLMHTVEPDKCLEEILRVLKPGGRAWIYVYGSGGIYWRIIDVLRKITKDITAERCIKILELMSYGNRYIAEFLDDWKVPFLRRYTHNDFYRRLQQLGCTNIERLDYGVVYDTSNRLRKWPFEKELWGEGDLRYLVTKASVKQSDGNKLSSGDIGSYYEYPENIEKLIGPRLNKLEQLIRNDFEAIAVSATIQYRLRDEMSKDQPFELNNILETIDEVCKLLSR